MRTFKIVMIFVGIQLCLLTGITQAQPQIVHLGFEIGKFTVRMVLPSIHVNGQIPTSVQRLSINDLSGKILSGNGFITIKEKRIAVSFNNIQVTARQGKLRATSGTVKGKQGSLVNYTLDTADISITPESINLTPNSATAKVSVNFVLDSFAKSRFGDRPIPVGGQNLLGPIVLPKTKMEITSDRCEIAPDGSITGESFQGKTSVGLNGSVYRIESTEFDTHTVRLGASFPDERGRKQGIYITGVASRDETRIFAFRGTIKPRMKEAGFLFTFLDGFLQQPPIYPEDGYSIKFSKIPGTDQNAVPSNVVFEYNAGKLIKCDGTLWATVTLPSALKSDRSDAQITIEDIPLKTNESGAAFASVPKAKLPQRFLLEFDNTHPAVFGFETIDSKKDISAWLYFSVWHKAYSSLREKNVRCNDLNTQITTFDITNANATSCSSFAMRPGLSNVRLPGVDTTSQTKIAVRVQRPGLSLFYGILYFRAPQIVTSGMASASDGFNLKTLVRSTLTVTKQGISGEVASAADSFILSSEPDLKGAFKRVRSMSYSWKEMLEMGRGEVPKRPTSPQERFQLAGLRLLDMRAMRLDFCRNSIQEAEFRYTVHFPFPSYIDLEFQDKSLDKNGNFNSASGPVSALTQVSTTGNNSVSDYAQTPETKTEPKTEPIPETRFLWAWRLPISFADRSVKTTYVAGSGNQWKAAVKIAGNANAIANSEIHVRPLYSKNSALKAGIFFSGEFDKDGNFLLSDYDREPFFARTYAKSTTGNYYNGFDCSNLSIELANKDSHPNTRRNDLSWTGKLKIPFYAEQEMVFFVKNIKPSLIAPHGFSAKSGSRQVLCDSAQITNNSNAQLNTDAFDNLEYSYDLGIFKSDSIIYQETGQLLKQKGQLAMASFTLATITPIGDGNGSYDIEVEGLANPNNCEDKKIKHRMINATMTNMVKDLVCYDHDAQVARNNPAACCGNSVIGTYEVRDENKDKIIMSVPNARAYPWPGVKNIEIIGSKEAKLLSEGEPYKLDIPGAQLSINEGKIVGAFGSTLTSIATSLPYEGELRFLLDSACGHYYVQSAGSFTYVARFSGQLFIVHAPYKDLLNNPFADGVFAINNVIDDIWQRALFKDKDQFLKVIAPDIPNDAVLTGVLTSGNISKTFFGALDVAAGSGLYVLHNTSRTNPFSAGLFSNFRAAGTCCDGIISAETSGQGVIKADDGDLLDVTVTNLQNKFREGNYSICQDLQAKICGSVFLGHCEAGFACTACCSNQSGFDVQFNSDLYGYCDTGGCD